MNNPHRHPALFAPLPSFTEQQDRARQVQAALDQMRAGQLEQGLGALEQMLAEYPGDASLLRTFRSLEVQLGEEYRAGREAAYRPVVDRAWGTEHWGDTVLKLASFNHAPFLMEDVKRRVFSLSTPTYAWTSHPGPSLPQVRTEPRPPRVSVIVPVYNELEFLDDTLASVHAQSVADWELILVDDGSKAELQDAIAMRADRIGDRARVITHPENRGLAAARNTGCRDARGEFVVWLDADDLIAPTFLADTLAAADAHPDRDWYAGITVMWGETINRLFAFAPFDPNELARQNQFNCTSLVRKSMWAHIGGVREEMRDGLEDWDFWLRAIQRGHRPLQLKAPLFFYRRREGSMLHTTQHQAEKSIRAKRQLITGSPDLYRPLTSTEDELLARDATIPEPFVIAEAVAEIPVEVYRSGESQTNPTSFENQPPSPQAESATPPPPGGFGLIRRKPASPTQGAKNDHPRGAQSSPPQRVLFVCHDFPPFKWAGAQLYALHLAKCLIERGQKVTVFHPVNASAVEDEGLRPMDVTRAEVEGVPVIRLVVDDRTGDLSRHPQYMIEHEGVEAAFKQVLAEEQPDVVHFHLLYRLSTHLPGLAKQAGATTVATLHDYWLMCALGHMIDTRGDDCRGPETDEKCARCLGGSKTDRPDPSLTHFFQQRRAMTRAAWDQYDRVLCPSQFLADAHTRHGFPAPTIHPLGWLPLERRPHPLAPEKVVFGFCGQIVFRKGVDVLIKAFTRVQHPNWELHVYGKPYQDDYFSQMRQLIDAHPRMRYMGGFTPDQLSDIYATLDVAIMPSRRENYPLTLMEGLSAGVPMIAANVGGVPEMMTEGQDGWIFPNGDSDRLAEIVEVILANPAQLNELRQTIRSPKTITDDAGEIEGIYRELLVR